MCKIMTCSCSKPCDCGGAISILSNLLSDTYILFLKTQNVHWNVQGDKFREIHLMTEGHAAELLNAIDIIAERIRMIGAMSPASFEEFTNFASISDKLKAKTQDDMIKELMADHDTIANNLTCCIDSMKDSKDFATMELLSNRLMYHQKTVWMLNSSINK